jgi:hypothetical protein
LIRNPSRIIAAGGYPLGVVIDLSTGEKHFSTPREENLARLKSKRVAFFRRAAAETGTGPTMLTSDEAVLEIYRKVFRAFAEGCRRSEAIMPNRWTMNLIVLKFLEVNELLGEEIIDSLLECEVRWYVKSGLRKIYDGELRP